MSWAAFTLFIFWNNCNFPGGTSGKEPACQCRRRKRLGFSSWAGKIPWRRAWHPTPVFLPGESHGQRSLAGYSSSGWKESDRAEATGHTQAHKWPGTHPRAGTKSDHLLLFWPHQLSSLQLQLLNTVLGSLIQHDPSSFPTLVLSHYDIYFFH